MAGRFKDLIAFLTSVQGDLSNITAPPAYLAPSSVVEVGHCWAQRPAVFAAPALEPNPEKRSLLVLRLILSALRSQFYVGGSPTVSIKKPLNPFLGELFLASWTDYEAKATTRLVSEQVSHHPPITAMHLIDEEHGIRADGYARVEMTFSGCVDIRQLGHAVIHIDRYDEDYLIPLPDVRVRGMLSGQLYPELLGTYHILSSTGYASEIRFSGEGMCWGGRKNSFRARMYRRDDPSKKGIYEVEGVWSKGWTVKDCRTGEVIEKYECEAVENTPAPMEFDEPHEELDCWESRKAWSGVLAALHRGDYRGVVTEKSRIEQGQREMRKREKQEGRAWEPLLFKAKEGAAHKVFHKLAKGSDWLLHDKRTKGVWKVDESKVRDVQRPFRGDLTPLG